MADRFKYKGRLWDLTQFNLYGLEFNILNNKLMTRQEGMKRWYDVGGISGRNLINLMTEDSPELIQITEAELRHEKEMLEKRRKLVKDSETLLKTLTGKKIEKNMLLKVVKAGNISKNKYSLKFVKNGVAHYLNLTIPILEKLIENDFILDAESWGEGSDPEYVANFINYGNPTLIKLKPLKLGAGNKDKDGFYFKFDNNTTLNLTKYQIYKVDDEEDNTHCFIYALTKTKQLTDTQINAITNILPQTALQTKNIKTICNLLKRAMEVSYVDNQNRTKKTIYGHEHLSEDEKSNNTFKPKIRVALYKSHYFVNEEVEYSRFYSNNYELIHKMVEDKVIANKDLTTIDQLDTVGDKVVVRRGIRKVKINSLNLINNLYKSGLFEVKAKLKGDTRCRAVNLTDDEFKNYFLGDTIEKEQRLFGSDDKVKPKKEPVVFFADTETDVCHNANIKSDKSHKLLLSGIIDTIDTKSHISRNFDDTLDYIVKKTNSKDHVSVYYHNLKYDKAIIDSLIDITTSVEKDTTVYSFKTIYKGRVITFLDSIKLITVPLRKFGDMFNLPAEIRKKEAIAYKYYKTTQSDEHIATVEEYAKYFDTNSNINKKQVNILLEALKANPEEFDYDPINGTFKPMMYYKYYLHFDCLVLREGLKAFNEAVKEITCVKNPRRGGRMPVSDNHLDIFRDRINTAASLGHKFAIMNKCYEGVYEMKGNLREYVASAIFGGRVNANSKYTKRVIQNDTGGIADYDGVSLYPSAMERLCNEDGIAMGKAKYFTGDIPNKADYYVVTIEISKINIKQDNPFVSIREKTKSGIKLNYINEIQKQNGVNKVKRVNIDKYTLEDWVNFQDIEYKVIHGVYWDGGFNKRLGASISKLFEARLQYKKDKKEALQQTVKLIMNSTYGKTIMKKTDKQILYKKARDKSSYNYIVKNWNTISEFYSNGRHYKITMSAVDNSYNMGHVGCAILSTSKRIMNEVMDTASTNNLPIYYQDTDSLHIDVANVPILEREFMKRYGKVLNGKRMGQFHIDFSMDKDIIPSSINACKSIFLGRKAYIDMLEGVDKNTGEKRHDLHIRMKGVNNIGMKNEADKNYGGDCFKMFEALAGGKSIEMVLNPEGCVSFDFKRGKVMTRQVGNFKRKIKF
jgi:hypothetical protein